MSFNMDPTSLQSRREALTMIGFFGGASLILPSRLLAALGRPVAVLVDDSHGGSDIKNEYNFGSAQLGRALIGKGCKVEGTMASAGFHPSTGLTPNILKPYDVVVFNGRYSGREFPFAASEITAIEEWVRAGGGLLVVGAGTKLGDGSTGPALNPVLKPFGLEFALKHLEQQQRTTKLKRGHPITRGINEFYILHGTPVLGLALSEDIAWVDKECVLTTTRIGRGRVAAFGGGSAFMGQALHSTILKNSSPDVVAANTLLLLNLIGWLANKDRLP